MSVALAPTASAHDQLVSSNPAAGSTLTQAPGAITLRFNEAVLRVGNEVAVTPPGGQPVKIKAQVQGQSVSVPMRATGVGKYHVVWRVTSADGHPVSGNFDFTLRDAAAKAPAATGAPMTKSSTVAGPTTPTIDEPGDNEPWLVVGGAALVLAGIIGAWFVARGRVKDDPR